MISNTTDIALMPAREINCPHCAGTGKVIIPSDTETVQAFYYGCRGQIGHYWWQSERIGGAQDWDIEKVVGSKIHPRIDGGFCYGSADPNDRLRRRTRPEVEGEAVLTHIGGWTLLSFWDRSVDKRGGSNSSIVVCGDSHSFATMLTVAKEQFPGVMSRISFEIKLMETRQA